MYLSSHSFVLFIEVLLNSYQPVVHVESMQWTLGYILLLVFTFFARESMKFSTVTLSSQI